MMEYAFDETIFLPEFRNCSAWMHPIDIIFQGSWRENNKTQNPHTSRKPLKGGR